MSDDSFDPAVVALLQEIAADPRASLLRIPKERLIRWVGRPEEVVKPSGSYLTKAEKHLVAAYREEAAWVLLQACVVELKKQPLVFSTMAPDPVRLKEAASRLQRVETLPPNQGVQVKLLAKGLPLNAAEASAAALRLCSSDFGRNCLAVAMEKEGQLSSSLRVLRVLLSGTPSTSQRAQALGNMARVWSVKRVFARALAFAEQAADAYEFRLHPHVWCLTYALQAGDEDRARLRARKLQDHSGRAGIEQIRRALAAARSSGHWEPTQESRVLISRLKGEVPEVSWSVCDVFA